LKKLVSLLAILILVVATGVIVYLGATLFDISRRLNVSPYFMQSADFSTERVGRPVDIANLSEDFIRDRLMAKFVIEYFYVIPDPNDATARTVAGSPLWFLSSPEVFAEWKNNTAPAIAKMAGNGVLQRVIIKQTAGGSPDIVRSGDFYVVGYDLVTYNQSNALSATPTFLTNQKLYLRILDLPAKQVRTLLNGNPFDVQKFLQDGGDPSGIFKFQVVEVRQ